MAPAEASRRKIIPKEYFSHKKFLFHLGILRIVNNASDLFELFYSEIQFYEGTEVQHWFKSFFYFFNDVLSSFPKLRQFWFLVDYFFSFFFLRSVAVWINSIVQATVSTAEFGEQLTWLWLDPKPSQSVRVPASLSLSLSLSLYVFTSSRQSFLAWDSPVSIGRPRRWALGRRKPAADCLKAI